MYHSCQVHFPVFLCLSTKDRATTSTSRENTVQPGSEYIMGESVVIGNIKADWWNGGEIHSRPEDSACAGLEVILNYVRFKVGSTAVWNDPVGSPPTHSTPCCVNRTSQVYRWHVSLRQYHIQRESSPAIGAGTQLVPFRINI